MASRRQVEVNRRSGRLGGPKTPEGKAVSRLNARKHGIFASALTPMDHEELRGIHDRCRAELQPVGFLEEAIVDKIAAVYLSLQRCARAHAEYHLLTWKQHPCQADWPRRHPDDRFDLNYFETTVVLVQRYDTTLTNQFLKLIHELQSLQERRSPEVLARPSSGPPEDACARQGVPDAANSVADATAVGVPQATCRPSGNLPGESSAVLQNEPNSLEATVSQYDTARPQRAPSRSEPLPDAGTPAGPVPYLQSPCPPEANTARRTQVGGGAGAWEETLQPAVPQNEPDSPEANPEHDDTDGPARSVALVGPQPPSSAWRDPFQPHPRLPYWHRRGSAPNTPAGPDR